MIALLLAAHLAAPIPPCVASVRGYLPTPSPCRVEIVDPLTGKPDALVLRFLVREPKLLRPGKWPLQDFDSDRKRRSLWRWLLRLLFGNNATRVVAYVRGIEMADPIEVTLRVGEKVRSRRSRPATRLT